MTQALSGALETVGTELVLFALFCTGFVLFRLSVVQKLFQRKNNGKGKSVTSSATNECDTDIQLLPAKELEANWAAGKGDLVLAAWPSLEQFTVGAMKAVIEALVDARRHPEIVDTVRKILADHGSMRSPEVMQQVLEVLPSRAMDSEVRCLFVPKVQTKVTKRVVSEPAPVEKSAAHAHAVRVRSAVQGRQPEKAVSSSSQFAMVDISCLQHVWCLWFACCAKASKMPMSSRFAISPLPGCSCGIARPRSARG